MFKDVFLLFPLLCAGVASVKLLSSPVLSVSELLSCPDIINHITVMFRDPQHKGFKSHAWYVHLNEDKHHIKVFSQVSPFIIH